MAAAPAPVTHTVAVCVQKQTAGQFHIPVDDISFSLFISCFIAAPLPTQSNDVSKSLPAHRPTSLHDLASGHGGIKPHVDIKSRCLL